MLSRQTECRTTHRDRYYYATRTSTVEEIEIELHNAGFVQDQTFTNLPWSKRILIGLFYFILAMMSLYAFMAAVKIMGESFTLLFACRTKSAFEFAKNPVAGLMVGIIATAMLHSSGTVTSVTVAIVGSRGLDVRAAIPIIMGANIGTSVTCVMVAFAQISKRDQFERAVGAATIHDMYNIWSVIVMFPLELAFHPLEKLAHACVGGGGRTSFKFDSPVDAAVAPFANLILNVNKPTLYRVARGEEVCGSDVYLVESGVFESASRRRSMSGSAIGGICLTLGFLMLVFSLLSLVHMLSKLLKGTAQKYVRRALDFSGYLNVLLGFAITFCVHSSTIVTSTLTPMAGLGVISLEQAYPLILGANVGTTVTALLASWVTGEYDAVQVALVHFWFNIWGVFLFYPIKVMRYPILHWAERLGHYSARWPIVALLFLFTVFILIPGGGIGLVYLYNGNSVAFGFFVAIISVLVVVILGFYWWYFCMDGRRIWHEFLEDKAEHHRLQLEAVKRGHQEELE
ncbi:hypothetical protein AC1031_010765 [Aphanomyces cochlioides]|nr:hypothetical protein AC1031_010765 [Aphanomyces cochlioides]